jgi:hypothetical protein
MSDWIGQQVDHGVANLAAVQILGGLPKKANPAALQVLTKWLLSVGLFAAADIAAEALAQTLRSSFRRSREVSAALALRSGGRPSWFPFVVSQDWTNPLGFRGILALADGQRPRSHEAPKWWKEMISGRVVGVLGPGPVSETDRSHVLASDIVAAPLSRDASDVIWIPEDIDVAYVRRPPTSVEGEGAIVWLGGGTPQRGLDRRQSRSAIVPRSSGLVGHPTAVPEIVVDLLLGDASEIRVAGVDLYLSGKAPYRPDAIRFGGATPHSEWNSNGVEFFMCTGFATHPPVEQKQLMRRIAGCGRVKFSRELQEIVEASDQQSTRVLDEIWGKSRR